MLNEKMILHYGQTWNKFKIIKFSSLSWTFDRVLLLEGRRERKFCINISNLLPKLDPLVAGLLLLQFMQIENMEYDVYNNSNIRDDIAEKKDCERKCCIFYRRKNHFSTKKCKKENPLGICIYESRSFLVLLFLSFHLWCKTQATISNKDQIFILNFKLGNDGERNASELLGKK
jgi:hypothetical protein